MTRLLGATVVTGDPRRSVLSDAEIEIDAHGAIAYVGPLRGGVESRGEDDLDLRGHVVLPGLVNAHAHSAMTLLRGTSDDSDLSTWLAGVQAAERRFDATALRVGLRLAMVEMIRTGTTTFADMYHWDTALAGEVVAAGMRAVLAPATFDPGIVGFPRVSQLSGTASLDHAEGLAGDLTGEPLVTVRYGPHSTYTCAPDLLAEVARRSRRTGLGVHIHLSESLAEVADVRGRYGHTPVGMAARAGLLRVPTLVAHAVHADPADIDLLAAGNAHGVAVAHNPVSNLKLGSGIAPVARMRDTGVRVALGTDGAASNNSLDMFEEIRTAAILHRGVHHRADLIGSVDALAMATREGAAALGLADVGTIATGARADLAVLDAGDAVPPIGDQPATSWLAFTPVGARVRHVLVAGRFLMRSGRLTTLDEEAIRAEARAVLGALADPGDDIAPTPSAPRP